MNVVRLPVMDPGSAYVRDMLWLPKAYVRSTAVQSALEYEVVEKNQVVKRQLWDETDTHLIVPREFVTPDQYTNYLFPFVDLTPKRYTRTHIGDEIEWRDAAQATAWDHLNRSTGGILNLACGKGKSVLFLKKISSVQVPALIVVNDGVQVSHWEVEIDQHLHLPPGSKVGRYQGKDLDWQHPICIATIQTLAKHAQEGRIPSDFGSWFGIVGFDEVHHMAAPYFSHGAPVIMGQRFGLTATPERLDNMQWVYNYNIGGVFYTDLKQDLIPTVYFQETDVWVDEKSKEIRDKRGEVHMARVRSFLGNDARSLDIREHCLREALNAGRKIIFISHSKDMLINLHERFPGSALCVSETPQDERIPMVKASQLAFAIAKLGIECLNDSALDALFVGTPFSSRNDLQQMLGRIQRLHPNKMDPIALIFDDVNIKKTSGMLYAVKKELRRQNIPYHILQPVQI